MSAEPDAPPLRADAERNRRRILAAAAAAFAEDGIGAGVDDIARRAGVGIATLYRRFPTKDDLVLALLDERMCSFLEAARRHAEIEDPLAAFEGLVEEAVAMRAADRSFDEVLVAGRQKEHPRLIELTDRIGVVVESIIARAIRAGAIRPGFAYSDLTLALHGLGAIATQMRDVDPHYWRRPLQLFLDGVRAPGALPGTAPARADVRRAFARRP